MDNIQVVHDDDSIKMSYALGFTLCSVLCVWNREPRGLSKTFTYLEGFVFELNISVPVTIVSVFNSLVD